MGAGHRPRECHRGTARAARRLRVAHPLMAAPARTGGTARYRRPCSRSTSAPPPSGCGRTPRSSACSRPPEYARAMFTRYTELWDARPDIEEAVRARIEPRSGSTPGRSSTTSSCGRRRCTHRSARRRRSRSSWTGSRGIVGLDTMRLGIVPLTSSLKIPPGNGFWLYDDRLVVVEDWHAELWLRHPGRRGVLREGVGHPHRVGGLRGRRAPDHPAGPACTGSSVASRGGMRPADCGPVWKAGPTACRWRSERQYAYCKWFAAPFRRAPCDRRARSMVTVRPAPAVTERVAIP